VKHISKKENNKMFEKVVTFVKLNQKTIIKDAAIVVGSVIGLAVAYIAATTLNSPLKMEDLEANFAQDEETQTA
jgi:hypothetical protein